MKINTARRVAVASAAFFLVGLLGAGPASAGSAISAPEAKPSVVTPGQAFTVAGVADCIKGTTLTVSIVDLGLSANVSGDAAWSVDFTAPLDAAIGAHAITITGNECSFPAGTLTVQAAATTTTTAASTTTAPPAAAAAVAASPSFTG